MPNFIGPNADALIVAQQYEKFTQQLATLNLYVAQLTLSPRHAWQMRLSNDMVLELGRDDIEQRLARFVQVYPYSLAAMQMGVRYVDLRYPNGFAVGGIVKG